MKLAGLLLKYEVEIGPPDDAIARTAVIVSGELWAAWLDQARLEMARPPGKTPILRSAMVAKAVAKKSTKGRA